MKKHGLFPWFIGLAGIFAVMLTALLFALRGSDFRFLRPPPKPIQGWCIYRDEVEGVDFHLRYQDPWGNPWKETWWAGETRSSVEYDSNQRLTFSDTFQPDPEEPGKYRLLLSEQPENKLLEVFLDPDAGTVRTVRGAWTIYEAWPTGFRTYTYHGTVSGTVRTVAQDAAGRLLGWGVSSYSPGGVRTSYTRFDPDGSAVLTESWVASDRFRHGWTTHTLSVPGADIELTETRTYHDDGQLIHASRSLNGLTFYEKERTWDGDTPTVTRLPTPGASCTEERNEADDPVLLTVLQSGERATLLHYEYREGILWSVTMEEIGWRRLEADTGRWMDCLPWSDCTRLIFIRTNGDGTHDYRSAADPASDAAAVRDSLKRVEWDRPTCGNRNRDLFALKFTWVDGTSDTLLITDAAEIADLKDPDKPWMVTTEGSRLLDSIRSLFEAAAPLGEG